MTITPPHPRTCLVLDFDNTLLLTHDAIEQAMDIWLMKEFGFTQAEASHKRHTYFLSHGSSWLAFQQEYGKDHAWLLNALDEVAAATVPLVKATQPIVTHLAAQLKTLSEDKNVLLVILSHNQNTAILPLLEHHGLDKLLPESMVFDQRRIGTGHKRTTTPYLFLQETLKEHGLTRYIMVEDSPGNLPPAKQLGWNTILVGDLIPTPAEQASIDASFPNLTGALDALLTGALQPLIS